MAFSCSVLSSSLKNVISYVRPERRHGSAFSYHGISQMQIFHWRQNVYSALQSQKEITAYLES